MNDVNEGQANRDLAVGLSRLNSDAVNLQSVKSQRVSYVKEQRRDVSFLLLVLLGVIFLALNLQTLLTKNLAYSIVSIPCVLIAGIIIFRRANASKRLRKIQEQQLQEFKQREETENA
ncbi:MAG: hypothetical protein AAGA76_10155 [Pseudomonadota bacterium]